ncbi:hypothetical protein CDV36_016108 [Fusarium kuroshium]|uniref:Uncharacterized protein n=1 Tax=Fusarium kuroshium TaxID=2010991 RepID=A0A3M2QZJ2_9HYPO|nr:hypothetical protein CDV36_016108 [Fusarium kuroshium]
MEARQQRTFSRQFIARALTDIFQENIDTIICGGYVLRVERKRTKPVAASCRPGYWRTALPRYESS